MERKAPRYYQSKKTLGYLYRAIDERQFVYNMQQEHRAIISAHKKQGIMPQLLLYAQRMCKQYGVQFQHHKDFARQVRTRYLAHVSQPCRWLTTLSYEESLAEIMHLFEPTPRHPLKETEVFAGQILGRQNGLRGKPLRDLNTTM